MRSTKEKVAFHIQSAMFQLCPVLHKGISNDTFGGTWIAVPQPYLRLAVLDLGYDVCERCRYSIEA